MAVWPWASHLTSLSLLLIICKMEIVMPLPRGWRQDLVDHDFNTLLTWRFLQELNSSCGHSTSPVSSLAWTRLHVFASSHWLEDLPISSRCKVFSLYLLWPPEYKPLPWPLAVLSSFMRLRISPLHLFGFVCLLVLLLRQGIWLYLKSFKRWQTNVSK